MQRNNEIYKRPLPVPLAQPLPPFLPSNPLTWVPYVYSWLFTKAAKRSTWKAVLNADGLCSIVKDEDAIRNLWCNGFLEKEICPEANQLGRSVQKERSLLIEKGEPIPPELQEDAPMPPELTVEDGDAEEEVEKNPLGLKEVPKIEHLQLTLPETCFLASLGVLKVVLPQTQTKKNLVQVCALISLKASNPVLSHDRLDFEGIVEPDNQFLVEFAAYQYFRQLGWVVKMGTKFTVDFLLYRRGPVFTHAELAVVLVPCIGDKQTRNFEWHELHCLNRVISQVRKTLLVCYVQCPEQAAFEKVWAKRNSMPQWEWTKAILQSYSVRCVSLRRWVPQRNRD
ncbi:tRNA-splicing endonuclease subunit catalytic subunit Sen2 [Schizosaccharomyces japonicus yFS275]|uniref:tRNA-splicing endonuclease subunit Sen2 n=1 Tax=Schizosaccharomyces japonicus (strain yFS275 / FY16936) TaxID=402676 RepID=B6K3Y2_SCHJY|nr:tRNA-splicing endonuclease subunit catalytic subunit Sen2 [Schizosaccharomyces japonicus yFS275]EEB08189.1 tRNA-splicing endonuclease subunit catalytic subunit Sen2 [Schizosaccharomyces japonicus yFS275]